MQKSRLNISLISFAFIAILFFVPLFSITSYANENKDISEIELYPGGMPFGVKISSPGLTIVKFSATRGHNASSAYLAGLREGDIIIRINGVLVNSIDTFIKEVDKAGANPIEIIAIRNNKEIKFTVKPKYSSEDGKYKTGIWVKDSTTGIGTITYINPKDFSFGGLGHAICDSSNGKVIPVAKGLVMNVNINGVIKGEIGSAGELRGTFLSKKIGTLTKNCTCGVFGYLSANSIPQSCELLKVASKEDIKEGDAYILSTLDGRTPKKYKVQISSIDISNSSAKNFKIKVTDTELINKSGGIVQGMSGSPIIQNGKIIGAVTHVLINDPTSGYGIFIENMLNASKTFEFSKAS